MRAARWRRNLIGDSLSYLRSIPLPTKKKTKFDIQIDLDVRRTKLVDEDLLSTVLRAYASMNSGFGYAQGMNFIASILLKVYINSTAPDRAVHDAFCSLHTIITRIRAFYPLSWKDNMPLKIAAASAKLVKLHIEMELNMTLGEHFHLLLRTLILRHWPCLFANMFLENSEHIWDYLLVNTRSRLFPLTVAMFTQHRTMMRHLCAEKMFAVIENRHMHPNLLKEALRLDKLGMFSVL